MPKKMTRSQRLNELRKHQAGFCVEVRDMCRHNSPAHLMACKMLRRIRDGELLPLSEQVKLFKMIFSSM
jgi:hypothetical protein